MCRFLFNFFLPHTINSEYNFFFWATSPTVRQVASGSLSLWTPAILGVLQAFCRPYPYTGTLATGTQHHLQAVSALKHNLVEPLTSLL